MSEKEKKLFDVLRWLKNMLELSPADLTILYSVILEEIRSPDSCLGKIESAIRMSVLGEGKKCRILEVLGGSIGNIVP